MNNTEMIAAKGRNVFFSNVGACCVDVLENIPGHIERLRVIIETDKGRRLVELPLETGDEDFARSLIYGVLQVSSAKCAGSQAAGDTTP